MCNKSWSFAIMAGDWGDKRNLRKKDKPMMTTNDVQLCECGGVPTWHGDPHGLREFCCDACWDLSGHNPDRLSLPSEAVKASPGAVSAQLAGVLVVVRWPDGALKSCEVYGDPRLVPFNALQGAGYVVESIPLVVVLAAPALRDALNHLQASPNDPRNHGRALSALKLAGVSL